MPLLAFLLEPLWWSMPSPTGFLWVFWIDFKILDFIACFEIAEWAGTTIAITPYCMYIQGPNESCIYIF